MTFSFDPSVDPDTAASRAHVLLESEIDARINAIRDLAKQRNAIRAALAEYEEGWQSALKAGWTDEQLRQIGLKDAEDESASLRTPPAVAAVSAVSNASDTPSYEISAAASDADFAEIVEPAASYAEPVSIHGDFQPQPVAPSYQPYSAPAAVPYSY